MAARFSRFRARAVSFVTSRRTRKIAIWAVSIVIAIGVLALVAPPLLRQKVASELSKTLHREVSIQQIRLNPYAMSAWIRGFAMQERQGGGTAVSFDELYVNLELSSLFRLGPVLKGIRLVKPYVSLVRNEDRTYNFSDLIEEFTKGPPGPTPRFSLNNIEIIDGRIDFDDRPEGVKHAVTSIKIGVPFISSLPSYTDITVQPAFSAMVNGSPVDISGETKPFKDSRESTVHLDLDQLQIPKYFEYAPAELKFKAPSGQLDGKLSLSFKTAKERPAVLAITGNVGLKDLVLQEKDDTPIINLPAFEIEIDALEVFANKAGLKAIKARGVELYVTRNHDGSLNLASLVGESSKASDPEPKEAKSEGAPFQFRVEEITLDGGKVHIADRVPQRSLRTRLDDVRVSIKGLSNEPNKKSEVEVSFQTDAKERFTQSGTLQLTPLVAAGTVEVEKLQLKGFRPYYESVVGVEIRDGLMDLTTNFSLEQKEQALDARLSELNAALRSLHLNVPGEPEPLWRIPLLAVKDATIDIGKKTVVIGAFESRDGSGYIQREPDGTISYARLVKAQAVESQPKQPNQEGEWRVDAKRVLLNRFKVVFEDRTLATAPRITVSELSGRADNFSNARNSRGKATIQAKINNKGAIKLVGTAGANPVAARFEVVAQGVEMLPFQPYLADQVNFLLTGGEIGINGTVALEPGGDGAAKLSYEGSLQVDDLGSVEKGTAEDLLKWKSLALGGIRFSMQPVQLGINEITLADFYSRVIIGSDGRINLQHLTVQKKEEPATKTALPDQPAQPAGTADSAEPLITIGKVNLQAGNVNFSDFFVKPNYTVNLTDLQGAVSELKPEAPGDVQLQAKIDNAAPVEINGKINPLAKNLFLDIKANARDIELSPLTPYSAKYVGYGIERGKLSLDVQYRLEDRKLSAQNKIILNQLTFGEKIESPTATKLPVLLAVALLKDRNGVIDVDLPIGGSLDDPEFSVGGIVLRIILNIITKAVTAPFALLGAAFGGGEELSYVEFDYGRARIMQSAEERLKSLATALNNRPNLRLEITGRVDPVNDLEGLKKVWLETKVKAQKLTELVRKGAPPKSVEEVQIASEEYPRFLFAAYKQEDFPKERNLIGLVKELPVPEMEKLMLKHAKITDADLRELASRRAQAVRDHFLNVGKIGSDRLFLVASAAPAKEEKAKGKGSRVDFSLR